MVTTEAVHEHSTMPKNQSRANFKDITHFRLVIAKSTNRYARVNDLDQEHFSELTESLVKPLLIHVVPPFADGKDPNYCLQINGNVLWEWRTLDGNLKKLFAVL